jgi:transcriptional regulator with XRE-family HTH domain
MAATKKFGARIRALREQQQISLRKFADKVGISPTYLSKVERDEFPPPGERTVKAIAVALGQDPDELLALAGKVSSDLPAIIQQNPKEMASFLRTAGGLSPEELARLAKYTDKIKRSL